MKRFLTVAVLGALTLFASYAIAHEMGDMKMKAAASKSWTGEVVDTGCYLAHEAKGEKHKECGTKCVANGMPMGLLTKDGKLFLLTMNHDNADPYNQLKEMVGSTVEVSGTSLERSGMKAIDVTGAKTLAVNVK
jgi:nitrogen fixation protein FixH